ncbi:MAG TPA: hypothetical protein PLK08_04145, partial [Phycisphaerae bacterium]|nr:hypothetical protein [Phycisphaerae bacterium]
MRFVSRVSAVLLVAVIVAGCVQVNAPKQVDVNLNDNTKSGNLSAGSLPEMSQNGGGSVISQAATAAKSMADSD